MNKTAKTLSAETEPDYNLSTRETAMLRGGSSGGGGPVWGVGVGLIISG